MNRPLYGSSSTIELHDAPPNSNGVAAANGSAKETEIIDAGMRSLDHYWRSMPRWRYSLRQKMLPLIRWETPYLAWFQETTRTPALDSYFAITANLGTHTFFMVGLPVMFWCGFPEFGKALVHVLAEGVFFTGFVKDMLSLPRPLSPPLHRITMSGSAALEYGFPSTHSANAVSVAVYAIMCLRTGGNNFSPTTKMLLETLGYFYAASIIIGRMYCGMHGFIDVIVGGIMGAAISLFEFYFGPVLDAYIHGSSWIAPFFITVLIIILVRVHPEPADDCPCFDDSVAFAGVMIGLEAGTWHMSAAPNILTPYPFSDLGWPITIGRIVLGVVAIVVWRETMKPFLLMALPYLFRFIEFCGVSLPRRFFVPASKYKNIPNLLRLNTDNVLPRMGDLPKFVRTLRAPARGRSVSIGPQSAADAYETLAYHERRRRESAGSNGSARSKNSLLDLRERFKADGAVLSDDHVGRSMSSGFQQSPVDEYGTIMGPGKIIVTCPDRSPSPEIIEEAVEQDELDEIDEKEVFSKLVKSRVRYDVEVVTKLIVYTGIAFLAVEAIPWMLEYLGLGTGRLLSP